MVTITTGGELLLRERARSVISTGFRPLDALLPAGGVRPGSLVEWLAEGEAGPGGGGAASLAFAVACRLAAASGGEASEQARPRTIVVVDRTGWFHPPAVMPWLGDERRLVVARPSRDDDEIWTIDQALRCTGVAAVLAWPRARVGRSIATRGSRPEGSLQQWSTAMRRWQLAAAASGAVGLFVRPLATRSESSWAETRIAVSPLPGGSHQSGGTFTERRLRLTLAGGSWAAVATDGQHATEVTLDLARGCAGAAPWDAGTPPRFAGTTRPAVVASGRSGVACRAS
jgi:hypothetical protein